MRGRHHFAIAVAASLIATPAAAQIFAAPAQTVSRRSSWSFDLGGQVAEPLGPFRANVDRAWGFGATVRHHFGWAQGLGLRGDFGYLIYGSERRSVPLSSTLNRVVVDMRTSNNISLFTAGPELAIRQGPVRPYVYGFAGYSYFYTESEARDADNYSTFASSTNFDDGGLAIGWGGGVRIPLRARRIDIALDAGVRHTKNGSRQYLRPGDITDVPYGYVVNPRSSTADFRQYHIGASFGFRGRR